MADTAQAMDRIESVFEQMHLEFQGVVDSLNQLGDYLDDFNELTEADVPDVRQAMADGIREKAWVAWREGRAMFLNFREKLPKSVSISSVTAEFETFVKQLKPIQDSSNYYEMIHVADPMVVQASIDALQYMWDAAKAAWREYTNPVLNAVNLVDKFTDEQNL